MIRPIQVPCDDCGWMCSNCLGSGVDYNLHQMGPMFQRIEPPCSDCEGTGGLLKQNRKCAMTRSYVLRDKFVPNCHLQGLETSHSFIDNPAHWIGPTPMDEVTSGNGCLRPLVCLDGRNSETNARSVWVDFASGSADVLIKSHTSSKRSGRASMADCIVLSTSKLTLGERNPK